MLDILNKNVSLNPETIQYAQIRYMANNKKKNLCKNLLFRKIN